MTRKGEDRQVGNWSTHAMGYILCVEKIGSEFRPLGFLQMADDQTGSRLLCQSIAINERFLCGYRLIID